MVHSRTRTVPTTNSKALFSKLYNSNMILMLEFRFCGIIITGTSVPPDLPHTYGGEMVSTGVRNQDKRAAVCQVCVKNGTLNINAKNNNNFALAA